MWASRMKVEPAVATELDRARLARDWNGAFNALRKFAKNSTDPVPEFMMKGTAVTSVALMKDKGEQLFEQAKTSEKKDYEASRVMFTKAMEKYPNDPEANAFMGMIHAATANDKAALDSLRVCAWPDPSLLSPWEARVAVLAIELRGTLQQRGGDPEAALASYHLFLEIATKVARTLPLDEQIRSAAERACSGLAAIYFAQKNKPKTLEWFRVAVRHPFLSTEQRSRVMRNFLHFLTYHISKAEWAPIIGVHDDLYSPANPVEEALLLARLLEDWNRKGYGWKDADATLPLVNHSAHQAVVEELEKALAFPLQPSSPLWFQYGLSLICTGKYWRGLVALQEHLAEHKNDPVAHLFAAKLCINHLGNVEDGLRHAIAAAQIPGPLVARAREAEGLCYLIQAMQPSQPEVERKGLLGRALETLHVAHTTDASDYAIAFHLALAYTHARETAKGLHYVGVSLDLRREHAHSWLLLAVLLSAKKDYLSAQTACRTGLQLYPDEARLLLLKSRIETVSGSNETALKTLHSAFKTLRNRKDATDELAGSESGFSVTRSARDDGLASATASVGRGSAKASTMSDGNVSSAERSNINTADDKTASKLLSELWLHSASLFLTLNQTDETLQCLTEARALSTGDDSPAEGLCIEGMLNERTGNTKSARELYQRALVFNPNHVRSLCHLGEMQLRENESLLAETTLSNAIHVNPLCHEAWRLLGAVYKQRERFDQASDCLLASLELEETAPVMVPADAVPAMMY